ncbi:acetylserotonin O-methyltransferase-like [Bidens hawaiensis]|uniref:acetylserotonin O-methyltransferase-like n=1 Tax=Bidens hawaiensis TaxID=980011 RepID=UPI00404A7097
MGTEINREKVVLKDTEVKPQEEIWNYILGFTHIALVKCAIELGIPDILENRESPITLVDLASEIGCSQSLLHRVMRFLIHYKVFQEKPISETSVGYAKTPLSRLLTRHGKHSMADLVLLTSSSTMLAPWDKLSGWMLGNKDLPFEAAHGKDIWEYSAANPDFSKLFNDGMACEARMLVSAVLESCSQVFEGLTTLVDVGGGNGTALRLIVEACPWIKGINFDLSHVVSMAPTSSGVEHVGGNMFDHVPKADAVFMMKILHNWADEECIAILRRCREAIPQNKGKVIIIDAVLGRDEENEFKGLGLMFDINMMIYTSIGKERNLEEWSHVFHEAGFTRYTIKHIQALQSAIELYP